MSSDPQQHYYSDNSQVAVNQPGDDARVSKHIHNSRPYHLFPIQTDPQNQMPGSQGSSPVSSFTPTTSSLPTSWTTYTCDSHAFSHDLQQAGYKLSLPACSEEQAPKYEQRDFAFTTYSYGHVQHHLNSHDKMTASLTRPFVPAAPVQPSALFPNQSQTELMPPAGNYPKDGYLSNAAPQISPEFAQYHYQCDLYNKAQTVKPMPQIHVLPVPNPYDTIKTGLLPKGIYTFATVGDANSDPWNTMFSSSAELLPSVMRRLVELYGRPCAEMQKRISEGVARANLKGLVLAPLDVLSHADIREIMNEYETIQQARDKHSNYNRTMSMRHAEDYNLNPCIQEQEAVESPSGARSISDDRFNIDSLSLRF